MLRYSLELSPTGLLKAGSVTARLLPTLPAGTRVYLPSLPADPPDAIERALALLRREGEGVVPVPHIPASRVASVSALERQLCAWQRASSDRVREALVVRGDPSAHHGTDDASSSREAAATSAGPFDCSLDLLESGVLQGAGISTVSLCGHPEGVGRLSASDALAALLLKLQWAEASGVEARVVTQFCFDAEMTIAYAEMLHSAAATADLHLGVVGPCQADLRLRMAQRCGVAPPHSADSVEVGGADAQGGEGWPTAYVRSLAAWQRTQVGPAAALALHVYPFGGLKRTLEWLHDGLPPAL